jgi:hypothetical protein
MAYFDDNRPCVGPSLTNNVHIMCKHVGNLGPAFRALFHGFSIEHPLFVLWRTVDFSKLTTLNKYSLHGSFRILSTNVDMPEFKKKYFFSNGQAIVEVQSNLPVIYPS